MVIWIYSFSGILITKYARLANEGSIGAMSHLYFTTSNNSVKKMTSHSNFRSLTLLVLSFFS